MGIALPGLPFSSSGGSNPAWADPIGWAMGRDAGPLQFDQGSTQLSNMSYQDWMQANNMLMEAGGNLEQFTTPQYVQNQVNTASQNATQQNQTQATARANLLKLQGITLTPAQQQAISTQDSLSSAANEAGAMNTAATQANATAQLALAGTQPGR